MKEEQGKKTSEVVRDAAVKKVIPAKPAGLSDADLDKVAGGTNIYVSTNSVSTGKFGPQKYTVNR